MQQWQFQEAQKKLKHLVAQAVFEPQEIDSPDKPAVVVLLKQDYERLANIKSQESLGDFLMNSPLRGSGLKITRSKSKKMRELDL